MCGTSACTLHPWDGSTCDEAAEITSGNVYITKTDPSDPNAFKLRIRRDREYIENVCIKCTVKNPIHGWDLSDTTPYGLSMTVLNCFPDLNAGTISS